MLNSTLNPILQTAIADVYNRLNNFIEDPLFTTNLVSIFGQNAAHITPKQFLNFVHHLPKIEIQKASNLQGALGAFSAQTNTIYLSDSLVNSSQSNQLTAVLLEEIGHYLDSRLNKVDTKGDEGELFSAVVRGVDLSPTELTRIQNENDQTQMVLNGKLLTIEQAGNPIAPRIIGQGRDPKISGNNVTWENGGEIYFWDGSNTIKITNNLINNLGPEISGNNVVWSGWDGNNTDIYLWNGNITTQLTSNSTNDFSPQISGNNVVWSGFDGNDSEIYFWNGTSVTQITNNSTGDLYPQISGSNVTWVGDYQNNWPLVGNIYYWNGNTTTQLTSDLSWHDFPGTTPPRISGTNVTWINSNGNENNQVYLWDGNIVSQLTNSISWKYGQNISDKNVAWNENNEIYVWNSQNIVQITNIPNEYDLWAEMSGNNVFWPSFSIHGDYGYLLYFWNGVNITKFTDKPLINYPALDISGNNVVWSDSGNIYFVNVSNESFYTTPQKDSINSNDGDDAVTSTFANLQQNDQIDGGTGTDTLIINNGISANTISINVNNEANQLAGITGTNISNFERFDLSGFLGTVNFTGFTGDDWIKSGAGNDTLNGGLGADRLSGGKGNDTYILDSIHDVVIENLNEGKDLVQSTVNTTLTDNVEDLTLLGTTNINGTGNNSDNTITGNAGNNLLKGLSGNDNLSGAAGNDILVGGAGSDRLTGGDGVDQFLFGSGVAFNAANFGVDTITDFAKGSDKVVLSKASFNKLISVFGNLQSSEFTSINSAVDELPLVSSSSAKIVYNQATGNLFYNPDGTTSGLTGGGQFATFNTPLNLTVTDFLVQA